MLVLSRKRQERVLISDNIVVTVLGIDRNRVRLGIEAHRETPVLREELGAENARPEAACTIRAPC
jgi:carbon storage regulator